MQTLLWLLTIIGAVGAVSYFRLQLMNATVAVAGALLVGSIIGYVGTLTWLLFLVVAIPINVSSIRQQYISAPFLKIYKKIMPEMSSTEQEAIDAGTVWWDGELFSGDPDWQTLHRIPQKKKKKEIGRANP
eukprot:TRINITY_DN182881_c0_g1_i1.p3 TRINITY_DN182881_c0_g1~~TRINITY_DN182881_c0_g1_i1.p3  ORF type:complete len:131 (-),score=10.88 TRINITY_DN182881_c0_g1_i1:27-419(-)